MKYNYRYQAERMYHNLDHILVSHHSNPTKHKEYWIEEIERVLRIVFEND